VDSRKGNLGNNLLPELEELLRSFASVLESLCLPHLFPLTKREDGKQIMSVEMFPDHSTHWYYVRQQPGKEFFTVRRVSRLPEEDVLASILKSESSWLDMASATELMKNSLLQRSQSVPRILERRWGLDENESQEEFKDDMQCRICFSECADVVLLPCRHGGMCYRCFRRSLFTRPIHRGGCTCPTCRRQISEVVRIGKDQLGKPSSRSRYGVGAAP